MVICTCIQIHRDINRRIVGYTVRDLSGNTRTVTPTELKAVMKNGSLQVNNLTLTSDGRLVSKKASNFDNTNLLNKNVIPSHCSSAFSVRNRDTFDKWFNNLFDRLHSRVGGHKVLVEKCEDNGSIYTYLYCKLSGIKKHGVKVHDINIYINKLPTDVVKFYVSMTDGETGEILIDVLTVLTDKIYTEWNANRIEKAMKQFMKKYRERLKG